jgi:hypothetical protein
MKKTLLFIALIASASLFAQTNLTLNSNMQSEPDDNDNADAWDMSPNSTLADGSASPYKALWSNSDLDTWLKDNCGDDSEAAGSSSDGNWNYSAGTDMGIVTRGLKLNEACRRLYQKVAVTSGTSYTLSLESRSESTGVPSEVFILNTEITNETGLSSTSATVDDYLNITNDFNSSKSNATTDNFTKNSLVFTPSGSFIVIYVRAPLAVDSSNEVFFDNIELYETASLSTVNDIFSSKVRIYPNPANELVTISSSLEINKVEVYSLIGKKVITDSNLNNNNLDVSSLAKGVYMMKLTSGASVATKKLIKE